MVHAAICIRTWLGRVVRDKSGQDLIEYALLAALVALVSIAVISSLGTSVDGVMTNIATEFESSAGGS